MATGGAASSRRRARHRAVASKPRRQIPDRPVGRADRDRVRRPAGRRRRGRRRASFVLGRRPRGPRRLRGRRDVHVGAGAGADPVAEPARGRDLRVRRSASPAPADRAGKRQRDPRPRPLGGLDRGRARAASRRDGARAPSAARLSVLARSRDRVRASEEGLTRAHDGDERRHRCVSVRERRPSLSRRRDADSGRGRAPRARKAVLRSDDRGIPVGTASVDGAELRLPGAATDRRDEARPRLHRPRARPGRARARRAPRPGGCRWLDAVGRRERIPT